MMLLLNTTACTPADSGANEPWTPPTLQEASKTTMPGLKAGRLWRLAVEKRVAGACGRISSCDR